jgi:hypothetical protein
MGGLIKDYHKSGRVVEEPTIVMFQQSKEYQILPAAELTPAFWLKRP